MRYYKDEISNHFIDLHVKTVLKVEYNNNYLKPYNNVYNKDFESELSLSDEEIYLYNVIYGESFLETHKDELFSCVLDIYRYFLNLSKDKVLDDKIFGTRVSYEDLSKEHKMQVIMKYNKLLSHKSVKVA
jgi:hypothetical protein